MSNTRHLLPFCLLLFLFSHKTFSLTLTSGQSDFTTSSDITETTTHGISSSFSGSSGNLRKIKNLHIITTGNNGTASGDYGIRASGNFNQVTNDVGSSIVTTGNSGRGISVADDSVVINSGAVSTAGSSSYGIYASDCNIITSSGYLERLMSIGEN